MIICNRKVIECFSMFVIFLCLKLLLLDGQNIEFFLPLFDLCLCCIALLVEDTGNEDEEESATEVELVEKVMEMNTQHLIEFDIWDGKQNKKNKKKKKKKEVPKSSQAPCDNLRSSKAETGSYFLKF